MLEFPTKPKKTKSAIGGWVIDEWKSKCGLYRITLAHVPGLTDKYRANFCEFIEGKLVWRKVSDHRELTAAVKACEKHEKSTAE